MRKGFGSVFLAFHSIERISLFLYLPRRSPLAPRLLPLAPRRCQAKPNPSRTKET